MEYLSYFRGTIHGGLAQLLYSYFEANQLTIPDTLAQIQHVERFEYRIWRDLLHDLSQQRKRPGLGLEIAQYVQPKHIGIMAYIAMSCDTLGDAMYRYHDLHRLLFDGSPVELEMFENSVAIRWAALAFDSNELITDEIAIALMMEFLKHVLSSENVHLHEVHFCHPAPKSVAIYEQYFRCKVRFSQDKTQIIVPLQELGKPFKFSDQKLQKILIQQAETLLEQQSNSTSISDYQIQHALLQGLQKGQFQIEHIAHAVNMSVRQLQRQLKLQNTSFQERIQAIRRMMSEQYLKDPHLSLQDIALLLGYSEQSAFQRAFKQWTGMTPQQWRSQQSV